jgi:hypothetical protein
VEVVATPMAIIEISLCAQKFSAHSKQKIKYILKQCLFFHFLAPTFVLLHETNQEHATSLNPSA